MDSCTLVVTVIDPEGLPMAGATVKPIGMRSKEEPGSCYGWGPRSIPGVCGGATDERGAVTISFPAHCGNELTTGTVIVMVEHADACGAQIELDVDAPQSITLERGTCVRLSAQAAAGMNFSELFADIQHDDRHVGRLKWKRELDGFTLSSFLPDGKYLARLVGFSSDAKFFFGSPEFFSIKNTNDATGLDLVCPLHEARTVSGQLDSCVPRPIVGGWGVAHVSSPKRIENACGVLVNRWEVSVDIDEMGSFVVAGLPEGTLEMIAGCEGYVSAEKGKHPNHGIRQAQVMPEDSNEPVLIPMERTGDARIVVLRPDGQPLPDTVVFLCPNQSLGRCTSIIGTRFNSIDVLRARHGDEALKDLQQRRKNPPFSGKTDAAGVTVIRGIPSGIQRFFVSSSEFEQPISEEHQPLSRGEFGIPRREGRIAIHPGVETSAEVCLEPKGSSSLSAAITSARRNRRRCGE